MSTTIERILSTIPEYCFQVHKKHNSPNMQLGDASMKRPTYDVEHQKALADLPTYHLRQWTISHIFLHMIFQKRLAMAPGVNLIISDMNEIEHNEKTRFTVADATISVTCKPKAFYSSSATQWFNEIYRDRIVFLKVHVPMSGDQTMDRQKLSSLILLKDSMKQFCLMNIREDYLLSIKGGDYLKREK